MTIASAALLLFLILDPLGRYARQRRPAWPVVGLCPWFDRCHQTSTHPL